MIFWTFWCLILLAVLLVGFEEWVEIIATDLERFRK